MDLVCEERPSDSPFVETVWQSRSEYDGPFISMAENQHSLVVTRYRGRTFMTLRGPTTAASPAYNPADAEFVGIQFKPGIFMPHLPASLVMQRRDLGLPEAAGDAFWLKGSAWQYPDYENADTFVDRLVRGGVLAEDPIVAPALKGQIPAASIRTVRRRFVAATGLTYGSIYQIDRARYATTLLKQAIAIPDVVHEAGYFDQPHLTRSLKKYVGLTPAQVSDAAGRQPLSFLYKTNFFSVNYTGNQEPSSRLPDR
ncbi:MAG TPA: helix-turn-helix domain-containing protein [Anaerolineales bacterium]|nr:helix-turn-helix domain-containing protein [Anaerolineales bacterium]